MSILGLFFRGTAMSALMQLGLLLMILQLLNHKHRCEKKCDRGQSYVTVATRALFNAENECFV